MWDPPSQWKIWEIAIAVVHTRIQVVQLLQLVGLELVLFSSWGLFGNTEFFGGGICELGRVRNDCNSREGRRVW